MEEKVKIHSLKEAKAFFLCGAYNPVNEAVSKQINHLSSLFQSRIIYSLGQFQKRESDLDKQVFKQNPLSHKWKYPILSKFYQMKTDIVHIFYSLSHDPFLKRLKGEKIVYTVLNNDEGSIENLKKVSCFVFECERDKKFFEEYFNSRGLKDFNTKLIYPGINLKEWDSIPPKEKSKEFTILFSSMPIEKSYIKARGVNLLISAAANLGEEFKFVLLNRMPNKHIYDELGTIPSNVSILSDDIGDIKDYYKNADAIILPFTQTSLNKSCPLSMIESLASGRPVILTEHVGAASVIKKYKTGIISKAESDDLCKNIKLLKENYDTYKSNTKKCAEENFSLDTFLRSYQKIYSEILKIPS